MNKLLRNPWVVAALVVGMAALWAVQMRGILYPGAGASSEAVAVVNDAPAPMTPASDELDAGDPLVSESPINEPAAPPRALSPAQLRWDSAPTRDPFGPIAQAAPPESPPPLVETPADSVVLESVQAPPALEAVLNTPSAHIAVIDGRIVRVGDKISGRPVLRIDTASVALGAGPQAAEPLLLKLPAR